MAGLRRGVSLLGMSTRVALPALLGLVLLLAAGATTVVRFVTRPTASPLTVQPLRMPMDGSCYVVAATGYDLSDPPPAPPAPGSPVDAIDAWSTAARATPVGSGRTRLTLVAGSEPVTVTGVDVSGMTSPPLLQRDWALTPGCDRGEVVPAGAADVPTVLLRGDLDGVVDDGVVTLATAPGGATLPLTLRAGERAHLLLDLSVRDVSVRWAATVRWTTRERSGSTVLDAPTLRLGVLSGARVRTHYGWDAARQRWVELPTSGS